MTMYWNIRNVRNYELRGRNNVNKCVCNIFLLLLEPFTIQVIFILWFFGKNVARLPQANFL